MYRKAFFLLNVFTSTLSPSELDKFRLHISEIEKITGIMHVFILQKNDLFRYQDWNDLFAFNNFFSLYSSHGKSYRKNGEDRFLARYCISLLEYKKKIKLKYKHIFFWQMILFQRMKQMILKRIFLSPKEKQ